MSAATTVLLLGGTTEARELAECLAGPADPAGRADAYGRADFARRADAYGLRVITSLAGRLEEPGRPAGEARSGGFGGVDALAAWLRAHAPVVVVDATHPFAARISEHARAAAVVTTTPLLRLARPGWVEGPGDRWLRVPDVAAAADLLPTVGVRPLLTTGRRGLAAFIDHPACGNLTLTVRCVEPPRSPLPIRATVLLARGPFTLAGERALLREHRIDVLVTRDSGGQPTRAKLVAARELGLPVVMVDRPPSPAPASTVTSVGAALAWVKSFLHSDSPLTPRH